MHKFAEWQRKNLRYLPGVEVLLKKDFDIKKGTRPGGPKKGVGEFLIPKNLR